MKEQRTPEASTEPCKFCGMARNLIEVLTPCMPGKSHMFGPTQRPAEASTDHLECAGCHCWSPGEDKPPAWTREGSLHYCYECSVKRRSASASTYLIAPELGDVWRCESHGSPSCSMCALDEVRAAWPIRRSASAPHDHDRCEARIEDYKRALQARTEALSCADKLRDDAESASAQTEPPIDAVLTALAQKMQREGVTTSQRFIGGGVQATVVLTTLEDRRSSNASPCPYGPGTCEGLTRACRDCLNQEIVDAYEKGRQRSGSALPEPEEYELVEDADGFPSCPDCGGNFRGRDIEHQPGCKHASLNKRPDDEERRIEERLVVTDLCDIIGTRSATGIDARVVAVCRRAVDFIEGHPGPWAAPCASTVEQSDTLFKRNDTHLNNDEGAPSADKASPAEAWSADLAKIKQAYFDMGFKAHRAMLGRRPRDARPLKWPDPAEARVDTLTAELEAELDAADEDFALRTSDALPDVPHDSVRCDAFGPAGKRCRLVSDHTGPHSVETVWDRSGDARPFTVHEEDEVRDGCFCSWCCNMRRRSEAAPSADDDIVEVCNNPSCNERVGRDHGHASDVLQRSEATSSPSCPKCNAPYYPAEPKCSCNLQGRERAKESHVQEGTEGREAVRDAACRDGDPEDDREGVEGRGPLRGGRAPEVRREDGGGDRPVDGVRGDYVPPCGDGRGVTPNASLARCPTCGVAGPHAEGSTCSSLSSSLDHFRATRDAAWERWGTDGQDDVGFVMKAVMEAEELVRRETIEACAKVCEEPAVHGSYETERPEWVAGWERGASTCARRIRALLKGGADHG